jgi:hypothetical protein
MDIGEPAYPKITYRAAGNVDQRSGVSDSTTKTTDAPTIAAMMATGKYVTIGSTILPASLVWLMPKVRFPKPIAKGPTTNHDK